jgi:tight adherence protein C
MADPVSMVAMATWALCAAGIAWYASDVAKEVTYVTLADGRRQERSIPLTFKMLLPFVGNLDGLVSRPMFAKQVETADWMLVASGFEGLLSGREFVALKFLCPIVLGTLWTILIALLGAMLPDSPFSSAFVPLSLFGFALFYVQPMLWLRGALKRRHESILKSLPFVLDILTLSVEAGMDFMSAMQRTIEGRTIDELGEEILRVLHEIQLGTTRRNALNTMSRRIDLPDMRSVINALVQADELGVSIGAILRIQSDQIRQRRFDRAERLANEAPVKMLFPLMVFIFPAVFIILLAPILSRVGNGAL